MGQLSHENGEAAPKTFLRIFWAAIFLCIVGAVLYVWSGTRPVHAGATDSVKFEIKAGQGFSEVANGLSKASLIRSRMVFKLYALATGRATRFLPGSYELNRGMGLNEIARIVSEGVNPDVLVRIPDGAPVYQVDKILAEAGVLRAGELLAFSASLSNTLEGKLYPDSYRFYPSSTVEEVVAKLTDNFNKKALPELNKDLPHLTEHLIVASLLEKEVPEHKDRQIVAGIIYKRLEAEMLLQVDSTVCYVKYIRSKAYGPCQPILASDLALDSSYNTYVKKGLPPGPIGSPNLDAIKAAMDPVVSPYWFYLSDPKTGKTIFSRTLDEHAQNRVKYLGTNRF